MTQEDKELLLKDLCSRLPYGVKIDNMGEASVLTSINNKYRIIVKSGEEDKNPNFNLAELNVLEIEDSKPYLFPLSSMTEEQCDELYNISELKLSFTPDRKINVYKETVEWFLKNHIDFNGLIPKGLAIDCTNLNIY